jgi:tRNA U54 and U55 pseudouridine synthase Pus10
MTNKIKLSQLIEEINETIQVQFEGHAYWVSAKIMNVKKYETNRRCYLTLEEYENGIKIAEIKSVFWAGAYAEIEKFEQLTKQVFKLILHTQWAPWNLNASKHSIAC